jgi:hypothetical protein
MLEFKDMDNEREKDIEEIADAAGIDESDAEMLYDEGIGPEDI